MEFIREFWAFLRVRKKLWLAPIIIINQNSTLAKQIADID